MCGCDDRGQDEAGHGDHDGTLPSRADVATGETRARLSTRVTAPCLGANNNLTITNLSPCLPGQLIQTEHPINVDRLKLISSTMLLHGFIAAFNYCDLNERCSLVLAQRKSGPNLVHIISIRREPRHRALPWLGWGVYLNVYIRVTALTGGI